MLQQIITDYQLQDMARKEGTTKILIFRTPNQRKIQTTRSFHREICPKGADGVASSVDP